MAARNLGACGQVPSHRVRCRAALAYLGRPALITGASALHELGVLREEPDTVEVLLPSSRWIVGRPCLCLHYATDFQQVRSLGKHGLPLTARSSIARIAS